MVREYYDAVSKQMQLFLTGQLAKANEMNPVIKDLAYRIGNTPWQYELNLR